MTGRCGQGDLNPQWSVQRSTEISDEAMPIEDQSPSTGKFNRWRTPKSTKFSDAPESMRTCTGESFNVPGTTADPKLDGAEARKGWCTDGTGAVIAGEATSFDEPFRPTDWTEMTVFHKYDRRHCGQGTAIAFGEGLDHRRSTIQL